MLAAFSGDVYKSGERCAPPLEQALRRRRPGARCRARGGGGTRPGARRIVQPGARPLQRAGERADAVGVRRAWRGHRPRARDFTSRSWTRTRLRGSRWACCSASPAAAPSRRGCSCCAIRRHGAAGRAGARAGRQGHHLRHRRHLDQAGRRHGPDEGRHGRRRRRHRRDARDLAPEGADRRRSASCR